MATQNGKGHESVLEATGAKARIARVYAEALMSAAGPDRAEAVGGDLDALVRDVFDGRPEVERFLESGAIGRKAKAASLEAAFGGAPEVVRNFLGVLNLNNRLGLVRVVAAAYRKLLDEAAGRVRVSVTSAVPLSDEQLQKLRATLTAKLDGEPVLDPRTDPDLLGGLVVRVGDTVYDSSVRTRLETLRNHLMASGSHGSA